ncbi:MAG TPA: class II glutamine amidotransferase [Thermoplasmata archaeon]|nr:class II glutamine amidotransferase [Thermoplasmata archaeon]
MCRMMGIVSQGPVYYDLFEEFADLAVHGMCPIGAPDERGHKDGWGLVCFQDGALEFHMRDVGSAPAASKYYGYAWKIAKLNVERGPGRSLVVLGHLRRASSKERVAQKWSHPFVVERDGRAWAFQHNGALLTGTKDPDRIDSQIIFEMLLEDLDGGTHEAVARATRAMRERALAHHGGFTALNFMLTDGSALHVFRDFQMNGEYYTMYQDHLGEMVVTASEPILGMKAEPLPKGVLCTIGADLTVSRTSIV